jgi:cytochrome c oxidase subunit 2
MSMPPRSRTAAGPLIAGTIIVAVIAIAVVVFFVSGITPQRLWNSFFPLGGEAPVTDRAHATRSLYDIVFYIAVVIFVAVEGVIVFSAFRYRRKPGDDELPPQTHGNNLVEVIWTAIPLAIVLFLFVISWQTLQTVDAKSPTGDVHVRAVAARFQWKFDYLDGPDNGLPADQGGPKVIYEQLLPVGDDGGLVLPVGEPVHITLTSPDVIHAFYVPKFLFKRDVVPGKLNNFDFTVDTAGTYRGQCAELCGTNHGDMKFEVHALAKPDFDAWLAAAVLKAQQTPAPPPSGGPSGAPPAQGDVVELGAKDTKFSTDALAAKADTPFTIHFTNDDAFPHNVHITDASGAVVFNGDLFTGPGATDYQVPALKAGSYPFVCIVHANMTGTLTVQ